MNDERESVCRLIIPRAGEIWNGKKRKRVQPQADRRGRRGTTRIEGPEEGGGMAQTEGKKGGGGGAMLNPREVREERGREGGGR